MSEKEQSSELAEKSESSEIPENTVPPEKEEKATQSVQNKTVRTLDVLESESSVQSFRPEWACADCEMCARLVDKSTQITEIGLWRESNIIYDEISKELFNDYKKIYIRLAKDKALPKYFGSQIFFGKTKEFNFL